MIALTTIFLLVVVLVLYVAFRRLGNIQTGPGRLERIRLVARFFKWASLATFGLFIFVTAAAILMPEIVRPTADARGVIITAYSPIVKLDFRPETMWLYPVFWILFGAFVLRGIGFFYRLFANLEKGIIFGAENVRCVRNIGWWLVAVPFLSMSFEVTKIIWAVPTDCTVDLSNLPNDLLKGFFVIFIAWIMDEGRKIQEEQELTV